MKNTKGRSQKSVFLLRTQNMEDRFVSLVTFKNPHSITIPAEKFERILRPGGGGVVNRTLRTSDLQNTVEIL